MTKKEIEIAKKEIIHLILIVVGLSVLFTLFVSLVILNFSVDSIDTEWQCTQWEETDELVNCVETPVEVTGDYNSAELGWDNVPINCEEANPNWEKHDNPFLGCETMGCTPDYSYCMITCFCQEKVRDVKCEHKKVCTQETLVRDAR